MKKFLSALALLISISASAQIKTIKLTAAGLTCSMCSKSIDKALQTLPFVASVKSDIKSSGYTLTVKPGTTPDLEAVRKKVKGAGFKVASMQTFE